MEEKKEYAYVQFPLCLLMETYTNAKEGLNLIASFGVVNFAKSFKYEIKEVGRQLMYSYYREKELMPDDLMNTMENYIDNGELTMDPDYCGFDGHGISFDPLKYDCELLDLFEADQNFKDDAILLYQIRQVRGKDFLNLDIKSMTGLLEGYETGIKKRKDFEAQFGPDAMASVKIQHLFEFRDSGKDLDLFRAYIAIKSIIGTKDFAESNKLAIASRMIGCKSKEAFDHYTTQKINKNSKIMETVNKYSKRYHMDNLLLELAERKFIMHLSIKECRIMYFSKFMEPEELAKLIKAKKTNSMKVKIKNAAKLL